MHISRFLHIVVSFILLLSVTGIAVSKGYCAMNTCLEKCASACCTPDKDGCTDETTEYLNLDSDLIAGDHSVKLPSFELLFVTILDYLENSVAMLSIRHSEPFYRNPLITVDIPVEVRCFRI